MHRWGSCFAFDVVGKPAMNEKLALFNRAQMLTAYQIHQPRSLNRDKWAFHAFADVLIQNHYIAVGGQEMWREASERLPSLPRLGLSHGSTSDFATD
jgi:hypothetical protein